MCTYVYRYKWFLVGISKTKNYLASANDDTVYDFSQKFIIYNCSDYWYDDLNKCIEQGVECQNITSYPDMLGCKLIIDVEVVDKYNQ